MEDKTSKKHYRKVNIHNQIIIKVNKYKVVINKVNKYKVVIIKVNKYKVVIIRVNKYRVENKLILIKNQIVKINDNYLTNNITN